MNVWGSLVNSHFMLLLPKEADGQNPVTVGNLMQEASLSNKTLLLLKDPDRRGVLKRSDPILCTEEYQASSRLLNFFRPFRH